MRVMKRKFIKFYAANARSLNRKQASVEGTLMTRKMDFASISKVNCKRRAPPMNDYVCFRKLEPRKKPSST